jgi:hypothetical protein
MNIKTSFWIISGFIGMVIGLTVFLLLIWQPVLKKEEPAGALPLPERKMAPATVSRESPLLGGALKKAEIATFFEAEKQKITEEFIEPFTPAFVLRAPSVLAPDECSDEEGKQAQKEAKKSLTDEEYFHLIYPEELVSALESLQNLLLTQNYIRESEKTEFKTEEDFYPFFNTLADYAASKGYISKEKKDDFKFGIEFVLRGYNIHERIRAEQNLISALWLKHIESLPSLLAPVFSPFTKILKAYAQPEPEPTQQLTPEYLANLSEEELVSVLGGMSGDALASLLGGLGGEQLTAIFGGLSGGALSSIFSGIGGSALSSIFGGIGGSALSSIFGGIGSNSIISIFSGIGGNALTSIFGGGLGSGVLNSIFGGLGSFGFNSIFGNVFNSVIGSVFGSIGSFNFSSILGAGGGDCYRQGSSMGGGYNTWAMCCNCGLYCSSSGCTWYNDCGWGGYLCNIHLGCKNLMCAGFRPMIWDSASGICGCG